MSHGIRRVLQPHWLAAMFIALALQPALFAGESDSSKDLSDRLATMEQKLDELDRQAAALRTEIESIRAQIAPATATATSTDLISVDVVPPTTPAATPSTTTTSAVASIEDVQALSNPLPANSATIFNPRISMIGNVVAFGGNSGGTPRDSVTLEEGELAVEAVVDPYATAKFYIGIGQEGAAIEEGYARFLHLPLDTTLKAGKFRSSFGRFNALHFHQWPTVDQPLVIEEFFGDEGLTDSGVSIARMFRLPSAVFLEATGEITRGSIDGLFEPGSREDLLYLGHAKFYRDLGESSNLEVGGSWARGTLPDGPGHNTFTGADVTWRWKPLERAIYRSFLARAELIWNQRDDQAANAFGYYISGDYQLARRWTLGARIDHADHPDDPSLSDRGHSLVLTFRPSEFSILRGQYRRTKRTFGEDADEFLMQLQFAIGAHGAHAF